MTPEVVIAMQLATKQIVAGCRKAGTPRPRTPAILKAMALDYLMAHPELIAEARVRVSQFKTNETARKARK